MKIARGMRLLIPIALITFWTVAARAEVVRIEVASRADVLNGKEFGTVGPYERILGRVSFAVDPKNPQNKNIPNSERAPGNAGGMVDFAPNIYLPAPKERARGTGAVFCGVPNRGKGGQRVRCPRARGGQPATPETEF